MRWLTNDSHREYFISHSHILFEDLFENEEVENIFKEISTLIQKNQHGHDLSRKSSFLREIVTKKFLARIAAELMGKKSLRLAYDQVLQGPFDPSEKCSFQGFLGGAILLLEGENKGKVIFYNQNFKYESNDLAFLVAYTEPRTLYILNEKDPHTHYLKSLGYAFGDTLKESTHPLLYSREL